MESPTTTTSDSRPADSIMSTPPPAPPSEPTTLQSTPPHTISARPLSPAPPGNTNISTRVYIYPLPYPLPPNTPIPYSTRLPHHNPLGLPYPPSEPTSTLVLTSPASFFVDLRFFLPRVVGEPELPNESSDSGIRRIEWAFAGWSESDPFTGDVHEMLGSSPHGAEPGSEAAEGAAAPEEEERGTNDNIDTAEQVQGEDLSSSASLSTASTLVASPHSQALAAPVPPLRKSTWHHWVDSRYPVFSPDIPTDTGIMYPLPNQPDLTLEVGSAPSPYSAHGHINYEELWRDEPIKAVGDRHRDLGGDGTRVVATLGVEVPEAVGEGARGRVIRVGQYVQGILKNGSKLTVERWEWKEDRWTEGPEKGKLKGGSWERVARVGSGFLPCPVLFRERELELWMTVTEPNTDLEWMVQELVVW